jgi:hypothetical protein
MVAGIQKLALTKERVLAELAKIAFCGRGSVAKWGHSHLGLQNQHPRQVVSANPGICRGRAKASMPFIVPSDYGVGGPDMYHMVRTGRSERAHNEGLRAGPALTPYSAAIGDYCSPLGNSRSPVHEALGKGPRPVM